MPHKNVQARGTVHYQHQSPLDNQKKSKKYKYYSTHQYQNDKKARMKQNKTKQKNSILHTHK